MLCSIFLNYVVKTRHNSEMNDTYDIPLKRVLNDSISNNEVLKETNVNVLSNKEGMRRTRNGNMMIKCQYG